MGSIVSVVDGTVELLLTAVLLNDTAIIALEVLNSIAVVRCGRWIVVGYGDRLVVFDSFCE